VVSCSSIGYTTAAAVDGRGMALGGTESPAHVTLTVIDCSWVAWRLLTSLLQARPSIYPRSRLHRDPDYILWQLIQSTTQTDRHRPVCISPYNTLACCVFTRASWLARSTLAPSLTLQCWLHLDWTWTSTCWVRLQTHTHTHIQRLRAWSSIQVSSARIASEPELTWDV